MRPELHPACATFPRLSDNELLELAKDIEINGLVDPITVMPDGRILDGCGRWDACELAGVEPRMVPYDGPDPIAFVLSKNKHRRHLDRSQKAMVVARLANLQNGSNQYRQKVGCTISTTHSVEELAKQSGDLTKPYIHYGRTVLKRAEPHIVEMVDSGQVNVRVAAEAVRRTPRTTQAAWTKEHVKREGNKILQAQKQGRGGAPKRELQPKVKVGRIEPPYRPIQFPTPEETGFPVDGTFKEKDEHREKYGRTPMFPKVVKEMLTHEGGVGGLVMAISATASESYPEPEAFFAAIDEMLTWVPQRGKTPDYAIDFAAKARKHIQRLDRCLDVAVERLIRLQTLLRARKEARSAA